jgi:hypothetical protein
MSVLRVNKITDVSGSGPVEFTKGMEFPANVNFADTSTSSTSIGIAISSPTGIMSATSISASTLNISGVCTATTFSGNGFNLTNVPGFPTAKAIALTLIT